MVVTKCVRIVHRVAIWLVCLNICAGMMSGIASGKASNTKEDADAARDARYLPAVTSRAQFNRIARTYNPDLLHPLPHVLFVIDRQEGNKIYYVNVNRYSLHETFINSMYLSLERGRVFWENNHLKDNRRFICGRIAYQSTARRFAFEFWEGDTIPRDQLALTNTIINETFFTPVAFKPNAPRQEQTSENIEGMTRLMPADLMPKPASYQVLNTARGTGRLRILSRFDDAANAGVDEIVVLPEVPISLPPVAGIVFSQPATPLSHVNLLARSLGIPNAFVRDAGTRFKELDGKWVVYETRPDNFDVRPASEEEIARWKRERATRRGNTTPRLNLNFKAFPGLRNQGAFSVATCGAKSANLGAIVNARMRGVVVPNGFTVPFYYYSRFMSDNKLDRELDRMLGDERFREDAAYRRESLGKLRAAINDGVIGADLEATVRLRVLAEFRGKGLFVRSSSNAEDLPEFNGAGLYDTVPNVRDHAGLMKAIKTVWASLWKYEAFEMRERFRIDHRNVMMAALIQEAINADSAGVMITTDPFDEANHDGIYINAKRGLGIRVVEGKRIAEQVVFEPRTDSVQTLTRSAEDSLLTFDDKGGVREIPITGTRVVLNDKLVRRLSKLALDIKRHFGNRDQDIEWAIIEGEIYILQSRPYIK